MTVLAEVKPLESQLVAWRRDLHQHPELGLQEFRTAGVVAAALRELGYTVQEGVATTGVVGLLENGPGPTIMVRADMDALPVQEENCTEYASATPGVMHACGHDAHIAMGLGVATLMAQSRAQWRGTLKMVFQPGEEGLNGAEIMVKEGVLENPRPEAIIAFHVWNEVPAGQVSVTPGPIMAAAEAWEATIYGKGGHAAIPEYTVDPVVTAALIINALQTVVSRNVGARETAVVTVGAVRSGDAFNVIPDTATLKGTIRTYDATVRETVLRRVREIIEGIAASMGARAEMQMHPITPALVNDEAITRLVQAAAQEELGAAALATDVRTMGSEDAAYFLREAPGCYFFVGSSPTTGKVSHHHPKFDIDEGALPIGVAVAVNALRRLLPAEAH